MFLYNLTFSFITIHKLFRLFSEKEAINYNKTTSFKKFIVFPIYSNDKFSIVFP